MEDSEDILTIKEIARLLRCSKAHVANVMHDCDAPAWPTCDGQIWPTWVVSSLPHFQPELLMTAPVGVELGDAREGGAFQAERTPGRSSCGDPAALISFSSLP